MNKEDVPQWMQLVAICFGYIQMHFFAFMGAFVLYLMNRLNDRQPFSLLKALNVDVSSTARPLTMLADMVLSSVIGAMIVVPLTGPSTIGQALAAGLGMTGILSAYAKSGESEGRK